MLPFVTKGDIGIDRHGQGACRENDKGHGEAQAREGQGGIAMITANELRALLVEAGAGNTEVTGELRAVIRFSSVTKDNAREAIRQAVRTGEDMAEVFGRVCRPRPQKYVGYVRGNETAISLQKAKLEAHVKAGAAACESVNIVVHELVKVFSDAGEPKGYYETILNSLLPGVFFQAFSPDAVRADLSDRPGLRELLEYLEGKRETVDGVLVERLEILASDRCAQGLLVSRFKALGKRVVFVDGVTIAGIGTWS